MPTLDTGYYNEYELRDMGIKSVGYNVRIQKNCTVIGIQNITIGNNVRIDGYCTIAAANSGWVTIGSYVHIGAYACLTAGDGIIIEDFCGISQRVSIYTRNDDYSGTYLSNPTVPEEYTNVHHGTVILKRHVIVGTSSVILPDVSLGTGVAVGSLSLVKTNLEPWGIYAGVPVKKISNRSQKLLDIEKEFLESLSNQERL